MILMPMAGFASNGDSLDDSDELNTGARAEGCMNQNAINYNPDATTDDGSCKYPPELWSPNGGEEWDVGSTQEISWQAIGWDVVSLHYSNDVGESWIHIATVDNSGVHVWTVPDAPNEMAIVKVEVSEIDESGNNITWNDEGNSTFTISVGPTVNTSDCAKFVMVANGHVGPVWVQPGAANSPYTVDDIVEWPAGSGQFWRSDAYNNNGEPGIGANWWGPCTCEDAWNLTQTVWDSSTSYGLYEVVEHNGNLYYSTAVSTTGVTPGSVGDTWILCHTLGSGGSGCNATSVTTGQGFNGYGGPVWTAGISVFVDDIVEFPAGSGQFWIAQHDSTNSGEPGGPNSHEMWAGPCNCTEIWEENNMPLWSASTAYNAWYILEWPANSGTLWIASGGNTMAGDEPSKDPKWTLCGGTPTQGGGPCENFNGFAGPVWPPVSGVGLTGEIYEFPAGSGEFYMVDNGPITADPLSNLDAWSDPCNCTEIWEGNGQPMWDSALAIPNPSNPYDLWYIVGEGSPVVLYVSEAMNNPLQPSGLLRWHPCTPTGCATADGEWPIWLNPQWTGDTYSIGDQVSFGNGLYISLVDNNPTWPSLGVNEGLWKLCECSDLPHSTWDNLANYAAGDIVVDTSGDYWISLVNHTGVQPTPFMTNDANGVEGVFWRPCDYCKLSDSHIDGVWNQNVAGTGGYSYGYVAEYNGQYFISISDQNQQEPTTDIMWFYWNWGPNQVWEFQFPIISQGWVECNCTEIANGAVYDSATVYSEGDVVIGPDGEVWISMFNNNIKWPGWIFTINGPWFNPPIKIVFPTWKLCDPTGGCDDDVPEWNSITGAASAYVAGDTVEWPGGTGNEWKLQVTGSTDTPAFGTDWKHCKLLKDPTFDMAMPPDTGFANLRHAEEMAVCDSRAVEASGLVALDAEDATYLCSAQLTLELENDDDTSGRGKIPCSGGNTCVGVQNDPKACVVLHQNGGASSGVWSPAGTKENCDTGGIFSGRTWSISDGPGDVGQIATTSLPGVTCASPIIEDVIAGYSCTDNIAVDLHKEWTAVSEETLSTALTYNYPILDDCRTRDSHEGLLCGSMIDTEMTMEIDGEEHQVVYFNPGLASACGESDITDEPYDRTVPCKCGVHVRCFEQYTCVELANGQCDCIPKNKDETTLVQVVSSVYDNIDIGGHLLVESTDILVDEDNDGVVDDWDTCPNTANGTATDADGCEVKVEAEEESGGLPGFSLMLTISALLGAFVYTNRIRRID